MQKRREKLETQGTHTHTYPWIPLYTRVWFGICVSVFFSRSNEVVCKQFAASRPPDNPQATHPIKPSAHWRRRTNAPASLRRCVVRINCCKLMRDFIFIGVLPRRFSPLLAPLSQCHCRKSFFNVKGQCQRDKCAAPPFYCFISIT